MHRRIVVTLCLAILLAAGAALAAGTVEEVAFYSEALGADRAALVYLPEGYETSGESYPVIYFIAMFGRGGPDNWASPVEGYHTVLDQMISDGLIDPLIFVEVDPNATPWAPGVPVSVPSFMFDSELNGNHESSMVEDLVPWVDTNYRTLADRESRYVLGASAGGFAAARLALRHWDVFGGLLTQEGTIAVEPVAAATSLILTEYPDGPPYDFTPTAGTWSIYMFSWCAAMTPNMTNPPWYLDLLIDSEGNLDPLVWQRFSAQSNSRWAAEMAAAGGDLDIFMDAGDEDFYLPFTLYFAGSLDALGIPYTLQMFHGDHGENPPWRERFKSHLTYFMPLNAVAESPHHVFNPRRGWPVQEFMLELPGDLEAELIALDTIEITEINGVEPATALRPLVSHVYSDINGNGQQDLTIWFSAHGLAGAMRDVGVDVPSNVDVVLRGETTDELFWEGTETLFVPVLEK